MTNQNTSIINKSGEDLDAEKEERIQKDRMRKLIDAYKEVIKNDDDSIPISKEF